MSLATSGVNLAARRTGLAAVWAAVAAAWLLGGCASSDKPKPAELTAYAPALAARPLWQLQVGKLDYPLSLPSLQGRDTLHLADADGTLRAIALDTGAVRWQLALASPVSAGVASPVSAGVGSDGQTAAVVTRDNTLVVVQAGRELWRTTLDGRVITAPLVAGERVFVAGADRQVHAFDAATGRYLWKFKRQADPLALSATGVLAAYRDTLLVGHGSRLIGLDPLNGSTRWDVALTSPRGTNEVERLADLVGPPARVGSSLCLRSFQNAVGCVDAERGTLQWAALTGGTQAVAADGEWVFSTDATDRVVARRRTRGDVAWSSDLLLNRSLSAPLIVGQAVAVGDFEGRVHLLARDSGRPLLRLETDGSAVVRTLLTPQGALLVFTAKGGVFAYSISSKA